MKKIVLNEENKKGELDDYSIKNIEKQLNDSTKSEDFKRGLEYALFAFGYEVI